MKPFKYWVLFLTFSGVLGFLTGYWFENQEQQLTVLTLNQNVFTEEFSIYLKTVHNSKINWLYVEDKNELESYLVKKRAPDLILATSSFLNYFYNQNLLLTSKDFENMNTAQSPALLFKINTTSQVPIAWNLYKTEQTHHLDVISLGVPINAMEKKKSIFFLKLITKALKSLPSLAAPYKLSLNPSDSKNLELESFIRSHELNKINIEN